MNFIGLENAASFPSQSFSCLVSYVIFAAFRFFASHLLFVVARSLVELVRTMLNEVEIILNHLTYNAMQTRYDT